ncbi:hypothetical protein HHK36_000459 [Tetracentron sinense]|uniref:Uncharacterized protein n=1 Tax=Tetracentron sinense TaxID=13715 RepID=A0A834ZRL7_TETSI|nr:hypothetical protein HHK36_000459 [Tetracentron sinense]
MLIWRNFHMLAFVKILKKLSLNKKFFPFISYWMRAPISTLRPGSLVISVEAHLKFSIKSVASVCFMSLVWNSRSRVAL